MLRVIRRVPLRILEAVEGMFCVLEVLEVPGVIRCVLLCIEAGLFNAY